MLVFGKLKCKLMNKVINFKLNYFLICGKCSCKCIWELYDYMVIYLELGIYIYF